MRDLVVAGYIHGCGQALSAARLRRMPVASIVAGSAAVGQALPMARLRRMPVASIVAAEAAVAQPRHMPASSMAAGRRCRRRTSDVCRFHPWLPAGACGGVALTHADASIVAAWAVAGSFVAHRLHHRPCRSLPTAGVGSRTRACKAPPPPSLSRWATSWLTRVRAGVGPLLGSSGCSCPRY